MMKRLFQQLNQRQTVIQAFEANEIEKKYSIYGLYREADDNYWENPVSKDDFEQTDEGYLLDDYAERDDEDFHGYTIRALKRENEGHFSINEETGSLVIDDEATLQNFIHLANLRECADEYVEGGVYFDGYGEAIDLEKEDWPEAEIEVYEYWNGSNWKELTLTGGYSGFDEVTEEFPAWDEAIDFAYNKQNTGHTDFKYYSDSERSGIIAHNVSYWQGSMVTNTFFEQGSTSYFYFAMKYLKDFCRNVEGMEGQIKAALIEQTPELEQGERLYFDGYELAFSYREEVYHFSFNEIDNPNYDDPYGESELGFDHAIEAARAAIQQRRDERLAQLQDISNNYPVDRIFVERQDSIDAGNCIAHTDAFIERMQDEMNLGEAFAMRADLLLKACNDNFTRRATIKAYRNGHYIHS